MGRISVALLAAFVVFVGARSSGQVPAPPEPDFKTFHTESALTCSQTFTIHVPQAIAERARLKARLLTLLRDSLYDDAKGIVNTAPEKEIKKLANKLKNERD